VSVTEERTEQAPGLAGSWWGRLEVRAAVVYLAIRLVSEILLTYAARSQVWFPGITGPSEGSIDLAMSWDAQWYQRIAEDGYPTELPVGEDGRVQQNPWAFYPLFPFVSRAMMTVTGLPFSTVAPLLALLAGTVAAVLMVKLFHQVVPLGPAVGAMAVWASLPASPALQLAYTESFSMVLLTAYLLLLTRRRWWWAAGCALVLGVTRPIALPLVLVALVALGMRWHSRTSSPLPLRERVAMVGTLAATGISGLVWVAISWWRTGSRSAYPDTMTAWRGEADIEVWRPWIDMVAYAWDYRQREFILPAFGIVLATVLSLVVLAVPWLVPRIDLRLRVWCAAYSAYLFAVVDGNTSIFRYLIPLFPLALVLVGAHRSTVSSWWPLRTAFWVAVGFLGQAYWIWWLMIFVPPQDYPP